jgi:capsular exopolysaccharide synthesis family protein
MQNERNDFSQIPAAPGAGALAPLSVQDLSTPLLVNPEEQSDVQLPLSHYVWLIRTHWMKMAAFIAFAVIATAMITARMTPLYESKASLYLDRNAAKNIVGQDSQSGTANKGDIDNYITSQTQIVQSDAVLRPVAKQFGLGPFADPTTAPVSKHPDAPVHLKNLTVTRVTNSYMLTITYRSPDPVKAAQVANAIAQSYRDRTFELRQDGAATQAKYMEASLTELRDKTMASEEKVRKLENELAVINPDQKTSLASAALQQLEAQQGSATLDRVKAESLYNTLRTGDIDAAMATPLGSHINDDYAKLKDAQSRFEDIKLRYGRNADDYKAAEAEVRRWEQAVQQDRDSVQKQANAVYVTQKTQEAMVQDQLAAAKADYDQLNIRAMDYQTAKQEAAQDRSLYDELVKKIRENEINASFQNDMVRIADAARPNYAAVYPKKRLNLIVAFFASSLIAFIGLVAMDRVDTTIRNPEQVAQTLKARVIGGLPMMKKWRSTPSLALLQNASLLETGVGGDGKAVQTRTQLSGFEEAVRTLRNSIMLTDFDRRLKCILMTSASPSEGKSTVAAHLAIAHAEQGHKTLLIDGDMRRPSLHKLFGVDNVAGLSKVLEHGIDWHEILLKPRPDLELQIMPAGPSTRRAADLVGGALPQLLDRAREEFDLVILDAPPLLGFPEPLQMAASVDGVIVVTRAGQTERKAVAAVLNTLGHLRSNVVGLVLNEVRKDMGGGYYYGYGYYGKYYGKYYSDRKEDKDLAKV